MQREQYDQLAALEDSHWWFVGRRRILNAIIDELLPPDERSVVVDIGCGAGANIAQLADRHECIGIDSSEDALAHARARFPRILFVQAQRPANASEQIGRAKLLMLNDVLEHVEKDRDFLRDVVTHASPGAFVLITVPADMALWGPHDVSHGHFRRYTRSEFAQLWQGMPVKVRLLSYFNTRLYPLIRLLRTLGRLRNQPWGTANTDLRPTRPRVLNDCLARLFSGEAARLKRALKGHSSVAYSYGVSLIAVLEVAHADKAPADLPLTATGSRSAA